jgi:hypothetical protein
MTLNPQKRIPFGPLYQGLVADHQAKHYLRIKQAVWLYIYLIAFVNAKTGKLVGHLSDIADDTGIREETLRSWLGHLRKWNYVTVEKQDNGLLIKVCKWKNIAPELESSKPPQTKSNTNKGRKDSSKSDSMEETSPSKLALYISDILKAPQSQGYFENLCRLYPHGVIFRSLNQARAIPAEKIKKSRSALFVYLLKKHAQQEKSSAGH